jgi:predicted DNA-binding transcriptional regulator YafY
MRSDRLLSLLLMLQSRGRLTAPHVARELEVSVRTVYRDVEALSASGVPVFTEQGRHGGITMLPGYRTDMTGLTAAEARALVALTGRAVPDDLGMGSALASAVHKLVAAVPASHRGVAEQARQRVLVDHAGWYRELPGTPHLEVVQDAVWQQRRLQIRYRHGDLRTADVLLDPYGLVVKAGLWYVVGRHRGTERLWRVDRVLDARVTDEPVRGPDVDLAEVWQRLRGRVERGRDPVVVQLRVRAHLVALLFRVTEGRREGPAPEAPPPDDDEWVVLDLRFRAVGAAVSGLFMLGEGVEVLAPPEVRDQLVSTARAVLSRYQSPPPHRGVTDDGFG